MEFISLPWASKGHLSSMAAFNWEDKRYDLVYNWFDHLKDKGHYINEFYLVFDLAVVDLDFRNPKE